MHLGSAIQLKPVQLKNDTFQESLERENIPDPMDGEQTWPTEEEMADAEEHIKRVKRVPAGMSDYQAAWIPDCDAGIFNKSYRL